MAISSVLKNFDKLIDNIEKRTKKAIYECSADLLSESNRETPIDSGDLRKSGKVTIAEDSKGPVGKVSYGDATVDYAAKVHEIKAKNYTEAGTGWKYLEKSLKRKAMIYKNYIQSEIKKVVK